MALRVTPVYAMNPPRLTRIITIVPIVTTAAFKSNPDKTRVTTNTAPRDIPKDVMVSANKSFIRVSLELNIFGGMASIPKIVTKTFIALRY